MHAGRRLPAVRPVALRRRQLSPQSAIGMFPRSTAPTVKQMKPLLILVFLGLGGCASAVPPANCGYEIETSGGIFPHSPTNWSIVYKTGLFGHRTIWPSTGITTRPSTQVCHEGLFVFPAGFPNENSPGLRFGLGLSSAGRPACIVTWGVLAIAKTLPLPLEVIKAEYAFEGFDLVEKGIKCEYLKQTTTVREDRPVAVERFVTWAELRQLFDAAERKPLVKHTEGTAYVVERDGPDR